MYKTLSPRYYQENKRKATKKRACKRYQNLCKKETEKKQHYGCEQYKNLPEDIKPKLAKYRKKYYRMREDALL